MVTASAASIFSSLPMLLQVWGLKGVHRLGLLVHRMMLSPSLARKEFNLIPRSKQQNIESLKMEEEKQVESVKKNPYLWQVSATKYRDVELRIMPGERFPFRYKTIRR